MLIGKTEKIVKRLEKHLRNRTRQVVKFDTEEETLQYLSESFRSDLSADFVGIVFKESDFFTLKAWSGELTTITDAFPIHTGVTNPELMNKSMKFEEGDTTPTCELKKLMLSENVPTWFTFPLKNELNLSGFCIIGYFQSIKLIAEMEKVFDEFGKDVAIAILYQNEKNHKQKLHYLLDYQQSLVKETVEGNGFQGITDTLSMLFTKSVILLDRFMRPISYKLYGEEQDLDKLVELAANEVFQHLSHDLWMTDEPYSDRSVAVWPINGSGDLLGYLAIDITDENIDDYYRLSIDLARNIYSIQLIKQKLVFDAKEQAKDSFINKLLVDQIIDAEDIIQYANLFNWDVYRPHRVAVVSISMKNNEREIDLLALEAHKTSLWKSLKSKLSLHYPEILFANKEGEYILIAPVQDKPKVYWSKIYANLKKWIGKDSLGTKVLLAVGGKTAKLVDYYVSYLQAVKALNVVNHRYEDIGFALFEELGAYTVLHQLNDTQIATLFINQHLEPLIQYSEGKNMDLFQTLRVYLHHNGSIKETSEKLFIHRSTLLYRLEKIESLLEFDLNDSEHRFNLMMAYKLYDLFNEKTPMTE